MFSLESVGIPKTFSNADSEIIKELEKNISMENNKYNVVLPWKKELIDKVESNFEIAKAVGIPKTFSNADSEIIKELEKNISMENNKYNVVLPWKKELKV